MGPITTLGGAWPFPMPPALRCGEDVSIAFYHALQTYCQVCHPESHTARLLMSVALVATGAILSSRTELIFMQLSLTKWNLLFSLLSPRFIPVFI